MKYRIKKKLIIQNIGVNFKSQSLKFFLCKAEVKRLVDQTALYAPISFHKVQKFSFVKEC